MPFLRSSVRVWRVPRVLPRERRGTNHADRLNDTPKATGRQGGEGFKTENSPARPIRVPPRCQLPKQQTLHRSILRTALAAAAAFILPTVAGAAPRTEHRDDRQDRGAFRDESCADAIRARTCRRPSRQEAQDGCDCSWRSRNPVSQHCLEIVVRRQNKELQPAFSPRHRDQYTSILVSVARFGSRQGGRKRCLADNRKLTGRAGTWWSRGSRS